MVAGDIEGQNVRIVDVPDVAVNQDAPDTVRFAQAGGAVELFRMIYKISFKKRTIDFGGVEFQDVNKPDIPAVSGKGSMLLPKMDLTKEVGFFWDRASKKLTTKCNPIAFNFQKDNDELVRHFKIMAEEPTAVIANEEIVHMRNKI